MLMLPAPAVLRPGPPVPRAWAARPRKPSLRQHCINRRSRRRHALRAPHSPWGKDSDREPSLCQIGRLPTSAPSTNSRGGSTVVRFCDAGLSGLRGSGLQQTDDPVRATGRADRRSAGLCMGRRYIHDENIRMAVERARSSRLLLPRRVVGDAATSRSTIAIGARKNRSGLGKNLHNDSRELQPMPYSPRHRD